MRLQNLGQQFLPYVVLCYRCKSVCRANTELAVAQEVAEALGLSVAADPPLQ